MQQAQPERELSQRPSQNLYRCSDEEFRLRFRITNSTFVALYNEIHHELYVSRAFAIIQYHQSCSS